MSPDFDADHLRTVGDRMAEGLRDLLVAYTEDHPDALDALEIETYFDLLAQWDTARWLR